MEKKQNKVLCNIGGEALPIVIKKEPRGKEYRKLIQYAFDVCEAFVLAVQKKILIHYPEPEILKKLEPYKIDEGTAVYYPNIEYYNQDAVLYFYKCNEETKTIIMNIVSGLYDFRNPYLPEDLTFVDNKGEVWMSSISHESMSFIRETNRDEAEFLKSNIGLELYLRERIYTEVEAGEAMDSLFRLIDEYFYLLGINSEDELRKEIDNKVNSPYYGFWNDFYNEYDISEHRLAFEIANFSNLHRLNRPIYAIDFSTLLNDTGNNSYLVQLLTKNINGNTKILYEFLENFKLSYGRSKEFRI